MPHCVLAILLPPLAVAACGRRGQAAVKVLLWLCLWVPGVVHALLVVREHRSDRGPGWAAPALDVATR